MLSQEKQEFIQTLADENGNIDPQIVVDAARDRKCILHDEFEWNLQIAAERHWLERAAKLIKFVKLVVIVDRRRIISPYYVIDPGREPNTRRYIAMTVARRRTETSREIILAELDRIVNQVRRVQTIGAALGLSEMVDELLDDVCQLRTAAEQRQEEKASKKTAKRRTPKGPGPKGPRRPKRPPPKGPRRGRDSEREVRL